MGRSKKSFDRIAGLYKYKDLAFKMTNVPVLKNIGRHVMDTKNTNLTYIPVYQDIEVPAGTVAPLNIIEHFINESSHRVILNSCICRNENECREYDINSGCTFLGEATRGINPAVGRQVTKEEAIEHLHRATESGLISCLGKFKGDAIALGLKDHKRLMTICHCCPCCCICTSWHYGAPDARDLLEKLEGLQIEITDDCNGCGLCVESCMFKQIEIVDGKAVIGDECKGCGRCAMTCKRDAVRVKITDPAYLDECKERIASRVEL